MNQLNITYNKFGPIIFTKEQYDRYYSERFIYPDEYAKVTDILSHNDNCRVLITGSAGMGKSTLLLLLSHSTENKDDIRIIPGHSIPSDYSVFFESCEKSIFIDDIDHIDNPQALLSFLVRHGVEKIVCTSRTNITAGNSFSHTINLESLTAEQVFKFRRMLNADNRDLHPLLSQIVIEPGNHDILTPRNILKQIIANNNNSNYEDFFSRYNDFIYQFGGLVDFGKDAIIRPNDIYIPSQEIVRDVTIINESLLKQAHKNPQIIHNFTPREFEIFVSEFLDKQGYEVKLTKQTRDGGKDLIVVQKSLLGEFSIYVECKKYDSQRPINVGLIRELYGTVMADAVTAGLLITTSYFTKDAKDYTEKIKHRMSLMDFNDLTKALTSIE
ncbi:restriction endonuclease [Lachnospiraceae bacterium OttesenSCG-928-D06]|nr:restriction endonuclease [Lachnospiraceae bacterium OttesenSCG-928-D06]